MGRGRGKGRKLTPVKSHGDTGNSVEEVLPTYKRRGRPQRRLKDDIDEDDIENIEEEEEEEEEEDNVKFTAPAIEFKTSTVKNEKKRRRHSQVKENSDSVVDENGAGASSINEESTSFNRFRQNGNRRKSKPRRAAEAGVECKCDLWQ